MLVRGIYYEGWRPQLGPTAPRDLEGFLERVGGELQGLRPISPEQATRTVFGTIVRHVNNGEARQMAHLLPENIRSLWPARQAEVAR